MVFDQDNYGCQLFIPLLLLSDLSFMVFDQDFMAVSYNTITAAFRVILYGI